MSTKSKDVHVQVFIHPDQDPPFHITSSDLPMGNNSELIFRNKGHNGFRIHFDLQEPTHGYLFPSNKDRAHAVWSKPGKDACPRTQIWDVFRAIEVTEDRKTLIVRNGNVHQEELGKFGYTLRVVKEPSDWLNLDPGGDNQNGGIGNFEWAAAMTGTIAGAIAAIGAASLVGEPLISSALHYGLGGAVVGLIIGLIVDRF